MMCPHCGSKNVVPTENSIPGSLMCKDCLYIFTANDIVSIGEEVDPELVFNQSAKADAGKLQLTLVPRQIIKDIAEVRMYGNKKYGDPDNWKTVDISRYRDAMFRHFLAYLDDPHGVDEESGIPHWKHVCCNAAFISEMETYPDMRGGEDE